MKITAEFNSTEELLSFIKVFGEKGLVTANEGQASVTYGKDDVSPSGIPVCLDGEKFSKKIKKQEQKATTNKEDKIEKVEAEVVKVEDDVTNVQDAEVKEEPKITKEMVRGLFAKLIESGKQKEAKELTNKYGASKLPEVQQKDYAAIYKDAEELL